MQRHRKLMLAWTWWWPEWYVGLYRGPCRRYCLEAGEGWLSLGPVALGWRLRP